MEFLPPARFAQAARAGQSAGRGVAATARATGSGTGRRIKFTLSDGSVDRMDDTIAVTGWKLDAFRKNPVALWAHRSDEPPIGRVENVRIEANKLVGEVEFAEAGIYPFADTVFQLLKGGFLHAGSVGFAPIKWAFSTAPGRDGIDFLEQELLEFSIVPVPANSNALAEARAKGINTEPVLAWCRSALSKSLPSTTSTPRLDDARRRLDDARRHLGKHR